MNSEKWMLTSSLSVLVIAMRLTLVNSQVQNETKRDCTEVLSEEFYDMWTNIGSFTSLFKNIFYTGCLVCSRPTCDFSSPNCQPKRSTLGRIPMYNNLLEFGLSGKYFPTSATVKLYLNKNCHYEISVLKQAKLKQIRVRLHECYTQNKSCANLQRYEISYMVEFDNQYCLYFGLALFRDDRLYITSSPYCNKFASANFNESHYYDLVDKELCFFNKSVHKPVVEYSFVQPVSIKQRILDGVPVIFPCSPGGFAVDPETGRLVTGKTCWKMFGDTRTDDAGIAFLVRNIYGNNEHLLFPRQDYNPRRMRPIFIYVNGSAAPRKKMAPTRIINTDAMDKNRKICEYEDLPKDEIPIRGDRTRATTTVKARKLPCKEMLSSVKQSVNEDLQEEAINAYIHNSSGCLICAGGNVGNLNLPVYHNLLEFGFSGQYFPREATVLVNKNPNCQIKIEIILVEENVTINIYECQLRRNSSCALMPVEGNRASISLNNWYCAQVGLSFHNPERIFYAFTFRCDKFAGSQFNGSTSVRIKNASCRNSALQKNAKFELLQAHNSTIVGVPIIVPCSSGGYVVNAETGEFTANETCDDMFWETLVNKTHLSGIQFILKNLFQSNEDFVFRKRGPDIPYPRPLYINDNGQAMSPSNVVPNKEKKNLFRNKCLVKGPPPKNGNGTKKRGINVGRNKTVVTRNITVGAAKNKTAVAGNRTATTVKTTTSGIGSGVTKGDISQGNKFAILSLEEIVSLFLITLKLVQTFYLILIVE